jgi:hypothetical protein
VSLGKVSLGKVSFGKMSVRQNVFRQSVFRQNVRVPDVHASYAYTLRLIVYDSFSGVCHRVNTRKLATFEVPF